ncbi:MAG TPA: ribonuclease H-like domain-containing protein [Candidatus Limnocylindrales bacterium]|nr:ribonuclease H-like domain-containing protein [Candidatus Limnocylindrales bacterium]
MARKFLAFDIETAKDVPGDDFNWKPHRPLGISCAATLASESEKPRLWYGGAAQSSPSLKMSREESAELVNYLSDRVAEGYTIVTWNGLAFDFDIMAEESSLNAECKKLALAQVDMMFHVFCVKGFPVGLDNAARGSGVKGKPAGMSGIKAPQLWQRGEHQAVLDYVGQDVQTILELALLCEQRKSLYWITQKGIRSECPLESGWLVVEQAMRLPKPDTSWMTKPMLRAHFTAWLGN